MMHVSTNPELLWWARERTGLGVKGLKAKCVKLGFAGSRRGQTHFESGGELRADGTCSRRLLVSQCAAEGNAASPGLPQYRRPSCVEPKPEPTGYKPRCLHFTPHNPNKRWKNPDGLVTHADVGRGGPCVDPAAPAASHRNGGGDRRQTPRSRDPKQPDSCSNARPRPSPPPST